MEIRWGINERILTICFKLHFVAVLILTMTSSLLINHCNIKSACIIGGGLAGLSCAQLLAPLVDQLTLIDNSSGPGIHGTSAISGGLIHPMTPAGKIIWKGIESYSMSMDLIGKCQQHSASPLLLGRPIVRPFYAEKDFAFWSLAAQKQPEVMRVISPSEVRSIVGQMMRDCDSCIGGVLFLKSDVVDTPAYLRCLWDLVLASCPAAAWKCDRVSTASMAGLSKRFDAVVVAAGPGVPSLWADGSASALPFNYVRGQNILYRQDSQRTVSSPMLCGEYIIPSADGLTMTCGSTQEHINELGVLDELEPAPCLDTATKLLRERLLHLCPVLPASLTVSDCKAGVRVVAKRCNLGRVPKISRHRLLSNAWLLTGFGSRGLVHHAFAADQLVRAVLAGHTDSVPPEMIIH